MDQPIASLLGEVAGLLMKSQTKIVFAESCTAGLISATLARVPGISDVHCGSAVVYRLATKTRWLGVPEPMLDDPGPVSEPVARAMAEGVLSQTPEAKMSAAITGHLGPGAPPDQDGQIFVGIAVRGSGCRVTEHRLSQFKMPGDQFPYPGTTVREQRQWEAVEFVLSLVAQTIRNPV